MATIYENVEDLLVRVSALETQATTMQGQIDALGITVLTEGADIHALGVGEYLIPDATVAASLLNKPEGAANSTGIVSVISGGSEGQKMIIYKTCSKTVTVHYECAYYGESWGSWNVVHHMDSGWLALPLGTGVSAHNAATFPCQYRKIGNEVFVKGCVKGFTDVEKVVATLPEGYRPASSFYIQRSTNGGKTDTFNLETNGNIKRVATTLDNRATDNYHFIDVHFLTD